MLVLYLHIDNDVYQLSKIVNDKDIAVLKF